MAVYEVRLIGLDGTIAAVFDTPALQKLRYTRMLNDVGICQLTLPWSDSRTALFAQDCLLEIVRDGVVEQTYIHKLWHKVTEDDGLEWLVAHGVSLEWLLLARPVDPRNDALAAGGYSTKSGAADDVIAEYVSEQAGSGAGGFQPIPNLTIAGTGSIGVTVGSRLAWKNLLKEMQSLANAGGVDFWFERTSERNLTFHCGRMGADKTRTTNWPGSAFYVFSPRVGNLIKPSLKRDWREAVTNVYLLQDGNDDTGRTIYEASNGYESITPLGYFAVVADARQAESATEYLTEANDLLVKHRDVTEFEFEIGRAVSHYRNLWNLGDRVTAEWDTYSEDLRISQVEVQISGDSEVVTPHLEEYSL